MEKLIYDKSILTSYVLSRSATYSNVFDTHRLGLVKIYEKVNKGESGVGEVGRSKVALLF